MCPKSARTRCSPRHTVGSNVPDWRNGQSTMPQMPRHPGLPATGHTFWPITQNPEMSKAAAQHWRDGFSCGLDGIRTHDLLFRRQTLYPLSYKPVRPSTIPTCADDMHKRYVQTAYADARVSWTPRRSTPHRSTRTLSTSALPAGDARASAAHRPARG